jgi:hypothetical protein
LANSRVHSEWLTFCIRHRGPRHPLVHQWIIEVRYELRSVIPPWRGDNDVMVGVQAQERLPSPWVQFQCS